MLTDTAALLLPTHHCSQLQPMRVLRSIPNQAHQQRHGLAAMAGSIVRKWVRMMRLCSFYAIVRTPKWTVMVMAFLVKANLTVDKAEIG